jgi:hypothetical protein
MNLPIINAGTQARIVALMWLVPDRLIERALVNRENHD